MREIIFILASLGLLICFIKVEIYFIQKSRENFRELKQAYKELKEAEQELKKIIKENEDLKYMRLKWYLIKQKRGF